MRRKLLPGVAALAAAALALSACEMNGDEAAEPQDDAPAQEEAPDAEPEDDAEEDDAEEDADDPADPPDEADLETIDIDDFEFVDGEVTVPVGTTVEWTQLDDIEHSVVFEDDAEGSDLLEEGDTFSRTFDEAGEFDYFCGPHPRMTGSITVEE